MLDGYGIGHVAPAPDGSRLAYTVEPEDPLYSGPILTITGPRGAESHEVYTSERFLTGLTWSPDGNAVAFIADDVLWRYDMPAGTLSRIADAPSLVPLASGQRAAWSPAGDWIAFQSGGYDTTWLVRPDRSERHAFAEGVDFAWSPDGSELAFTNRGISIARPDGSGLRHLAATPVGTAVGSLAWSPNGQAIAYSGGPGLDGAQLCVLSLRGGIRQLDACVAGNTRPAWADDSRWLAYIAQSSPDCEHDPDYHFAIADAMTGETRRLPGRPSPLPQDDPHWLP